MTFNSIIQFVLVLCVCFSTTHGLQANLLAKETSSSLLLACPNLNQPDIKELTIIRKNPFQDIVFVYIKDTFDRMSVTSTTIQNYHDGQFVLPDFVSFERVLKREVHGWGVYIFYSNRTLFRQAECQELSHSTKL